MKTALVKCAYHSSIEDTVRDWFAAMAVQVLGQHPDVSLLLDFLRTGYAELDVGARAPANTIIY